MTDDRFWVLIDRLDWAHQGNDDLVVEPVVSDLASGPLDEIRSFQEQLARKLYALDGRAWALAIGPPVWLGEPDQVDVDEFLYARCAVVANGRDAYGQVLSDPSLMPTDLEFEALLYVAPAAYERLTGEEDEELDSTSVSFETFSNADGWS